MNRIAFSTVTLSGTFGAKVRAMRQAGFEATEVWARDLFEHFEGPEIALRILRDEGMAVTALQAIRHFEGCQPGERALKLDIARRMMDLANLAGAPLVTLAANSQESARGDTACLIDDLGELAQEAASRGLRIAYEPIVWAPHVNHWRRALELLDAVNSPALGLQLDVFHAFVGGDTRIAVDQIAPQRIFLVEVCDLVPMGMPAIEISRNYRLLPGEGSMPLEPFFADLRAAGYTGDVVVEIFNAACLTQPAETVAHKAWQSMWPWFGDKGISR